MERTDAQVREEVRARYAAAARIVNTDGEACCDTGGCGCAGATDEVASADESAQRELDGCGCTGYADDELSALPADAVAASLGCGNPTAVADLRGGEVVLDLGSGGGIDVLLSARRVGPSGHVYGLDMTDEMLALARRGAEQAGARNVEFLKGHIEEIPLPDGTADVVVSNCVINLSTDKPAALREAHRVLRPGGRLGVTDIVAEDRLSPAERAQRGSYVGCVAGALSKGEYERALREAGFRDVSVTYTSEVADGIHGAIVKARKPW